MNNNKLKSTKEIIYLDNYVRINQKYSDEHSFHQLILLPLCFPEKVTIL